MKYTISSKILSTDHETLTDFFCIHCDRSVHGFCEIHGNLIKGIAF